MRFSILSALGLCASAAAASVDSYISSEGPAAKQGLLANIGPDGAKAKAAGAKAGVVIASPNTDNPNYLYSWVRDASLVAKVLIDQYTEGVDDSLRDLIDDYVSAEATFQQLDNPSGSVSSGGLGEPKFYINLTAFEGPWGRPQRDGPALRSTALITYANWLLDNNNSSFVSKTLWPIIKLDLDYVHDKWNSTSFDLWEEIESHSFWTTAVQHRSLREGAALASKISESSSGYSSEADNVLCYLQSYWNATGSYIVSNTGGGRSGIDANSALASIYTFDPEAGCDAVTFQPCSDVALASLKTYVDSFRSLYPINDGIDDNAAVATGRYPEDVYQNGNPWYLTTAAVAEQLYDALTVWSGQGSFSVTPVSLPFFQQFSDTISTGSYDSSSSTYKNVTGAVKDFADGFLEINAKYTPSDGGLAEQYGKSDGKPLSAVDLTWSYASALTAFAARNGTKPASWGAKGLSVASSCGTKAGSTVSVTFNVNATTNEGEHVYVAGSGGDLKSWSPDNALKLSAADYPKWSIKVDVPASATIQYKYLKKSDSGNVNWEADPNRSIDTPASSSTSTADSWQS
ncbi:carbohydrate-binding module family 20 protein [Plicaturopsis crispa FD-325 SS-3]|uniref:Glucoamylase n=1 Tax=Plicaturopsis crispa FD-325 SS-3 TaxID=944288 RepID=A0A0C9SVG0_PLICR|nr:carbohydrate-binding module family 20 protein [Plicaturopsis crispa FD-325 SS-3]